MNGPVAIGTGGVSRPDVVAVAREACPVVIEPAALEAVRRSHRIATELIAGDRAVYGLSTGFGALADRYIEPESPGRPAGRAWSGRTPPPWAPRSNRRWCGP